MRDDSAIVRQLTRSIPTPGDYSVKFQQRVFLITLSALSLTLIAGISRAAPLSLLKALTCVFVLIACVILDQIRNLKLTLLILTVNALQRRIFAGDLFYMANDYLIALPFLPMVAIVLKELKASFSDKTLNFLIFGLTVLTVFSINSDVVQIGWGYANLLLTLLVAVKSVKYFDKNIIIFIMRLGIFESLFVISQRISMQKFDVGWCISVRKFLVVNEICGSDSPRLWGSMESAINTGCFLATTFMMLFYFPAVGRKLVFKTMSLFLMFSALFLTGSRTFIFLIPCIIGLVGIKRKFSAPAILGGVLVLFGTFTSLPSIAAYLHYDSRWIDRLNFKNLSGDTSLNARFNLLQTFSDNFTVRNVLFGSGVGSRSRGSGAIDNGYFSMMIEIGLPLMLCFMAYIIANMGLSLKVEGFQFSVFAGTLMLFLSNLSFSVFTGSSGFLLWLFSANSHNENLSEGRNPD